MGLPASGTRSLEDAFLLIMYSLHSATKSSRVLWGPFSYA
jgi:hypothetical protein